MERSIELEKRVKQAIIQAEEDKGPLGIEEAYLYLRAWLCVEFNINVKEVNNG